MSDGGFASLLIYSPGDTNRRPPQSQVMITLFASSKDSSSRAIAKSAWGSGDAHIQSIATQHPRPQAVGARGASLLPLRLSAKPSPGALGPGLLSAF